MVVRPFRIRFGRFNAALLGAMGMGRRRSYVEVDGDVVRVRMGWWFKADIDRRSITRAEPRGRYVWQGYGVHGWRGWWIVNGSGHDIVVVCMDPPARARATGVRVKLRELWVSLEDPDGFLAAIGR